MSSKFKIAPVFEFLILNFELIWRILSYVSLWGRWVRSGLHTGGLDGVWWIQGLGSGASCCR
ncbi:MAG: hypothetical protein J7647_17000 [Cyanobacteria bacterium SBLK]|nr:hypothetical protein [Cyanobacteria bacterium SBLK]